jgi:hypothetical protein
VLITREEAEESVELLTGWHPLECERWRWTERIFAVRLSKPLANAPIVRFRFTIAEAVLQETGVVRLRASVNGVELEAGEFTAPGEHVYAQSIPPAAFRAGECPLIRFELENALRSPAPIGGSWVSKLCSGPTAIRRAGRCTRSR